MSTAAKKRVVLALLTACAVWPLAHYALSVRYGLNPWKFFGWAMYSAPPPRIELKLNGRRGGRPVPVPRLAEFRAAAGAFARRRAAYGRLLPPDRLARTVLSARPGLDGLSIRVRRWVLDPGSARIVPRDRTYRYDAADPR